MNALLRALLLRNRYCAPVGPDGELPGGAAADEVDDDAGDGDVSDDDTDADADDTPADDADDKPADEEDDGAPLVVSLGDEESAGVDDEDAIAAALPDGTPNAAFARLRVERKDLRRQTQDQAARIRQLEEQVAATKPAEQTIVVGPEPTIEGCDFDGERFATEFKAWIGKKAQADDQQRRHQQAREEQERQWNTRIDAVTAAAKDLGSRVKNHDEALQTFETAFSPVQQGLILGAPDDAKTSAMLRYALGSNPAKARELAAIKDPVKFTWAAANLVATMKVSKTSKNTPPAPERRPASNVTGAAAVVASLDRLRAEADKTGDRSKVAAHIRAKNKQAA